MNAFVYFGIATVARRGSTFFGSPSCMLSSLSRNGHSVRFRFSTSSVQVVSSSSEVKKGNPSFASKILDHFAENYTKNTPTAVRILEDLHSAGEVVRNDHVAFRSFSGDLGIKAIEAPFILTGFQKMEALFFPEKKLRAHWYRPPNPNLPRVFISEIIVDQLSTKSQEIINKYLKEVDPAVSALVPLAAAIEHRPWPMPSAEDYDILSKESEYAGWVLVHDFKINHVTVSVHGMKVYNRLEKLNAFLKEKKYVLNDSSGEIKVSEDGLLKQSSTIADKMEIAFSDGSTRTIPYAYIEFAERLPLPQYQHLPPEQITEELRRDGFEASNADKIFESTYVKQANRSH
mmetsp:Transcript_29452/g.49550  ORF Transcript_29452/g.49550 Transcript_29452/m.49550 type:complete len:345 (-) Transcript_29452:1484-2518(-)|eukprot:CAMPEP_0184648376 /NCGR_PEP_ID=MMETSP0308-20130426/5487_1 /TAXON_ID=38269 /ORGANISM="Gloeochaete witrockiana, Strain SAG 46.84" /LENGTH=344 /DNA_ID=CAMNT_0027080153 /DNA_START=67 /DNA_END=1101 /DNA_ORIENTATION=-